MKKRCQESFLFFLLALAAAGCGCDSSAPSSEAVRLRSHMTQDPSSLSLIGKPDQNSDIIASLVTDSLVKYDDNLVLQPRLARSWEVSSDRLTWTFTLRDGVKWQDGVPFTSRDVVFTVEKVRDPATEARSYRSAFEDLASIEAVDQLTVRATYRAPYADVLDYWTLPMIPEHLVGKDPQFLSGEFSRHPVGCGPFRLVHTDPGREILLEANPSYWDGRPLLDQIAFRILPDERTAFEALLQGDLDLMHVTPDLWKEALASTRASRLSRFVYYRHAVWYVGWNQDGSNPFFGDPGTRRAMVMALDRPRFIAQALGNLARSAVGTYHPDSPWFDRSVTPWPYDPAAAGRLLDEAGWKDNDHDGVRERDGVPFAFTLLVPASTQEIVDRIAVWVQDSLGKIGVRMSIERIEWRAFQERRREHRFQAAMASLTFSPAPDRFEIYHSSARAHGFNYVGLCDPEVDRLLMEGRRTFDPASRREIYRRLQRRLHELEPLSCLFNFAAPVLFDSRLEGLKRTPLGLSLGLWQTTPGPRQWRFSPGTRGG